MKSFITLVFATIVALNAAVTAADVPIYNSTDGTFVCPSSIYFYAAYCVPDTNIIIRCTGTKGQPGNCNDNLDGEPPIGLTYSPCWEPFPGSGQAACSKNCVVYGGSGNFNETFTLPLSNCTPTYTASVSSATTPPGTLYTTITNAYTTITVPCSSSSTLGGSISYPVGNSTFTTPSQGTYPTTTPSGYPTTTSSGYPATTLSSNATATPVGPTSAKPAQVTGAAAATQVGGVLAVAGLLVAYFL